MDGAQGTCFVSSLQWRVQPIRLGAACVTQQRRAQWASPVVQRPRQERSPGRWLLRRPSRSCPRRQDGAWGPVMAVREIDTQEEMERALTEAGDALVVVDYGTTWCGPCKLMEPKLQSWSEEYTKVVFLKVIGDKSKETSMMMKAAGIRSVPSFHFYKNGERIHTINGAKSDEILSSIETHM
ncbi:hypothetical protein CCYA_CCYA08G2279 [Cyanidiococcus yangmingshanensis]|nr:hypothetical protein CCYA_CCYA08G2279 [Cyanidiococcus yangmingshanensis]